VSRGPHEARDAILGVSHVNDICSVGRFLSKWAGLSDSRTEYKAFLLNNC
jgi:hypothetical protein